ncbi:class I SAM-dependent methyltransferase [Ferdinandcohnia quinoae]|uniref:Class I SAM-dependent methyltransferase n=1 Tax=Fredinandcohnia quinoae TaxID=2918902 RepID=A0AAW5E4F4_9BACI|nr:class I SAM-dependent methyltransferase [Fredinandcohnia sp. SECRCQ15]MCH1627368.1 class I SAM-dependent methyltransferase [Fredinandcohnia sp. SECRCQ15]
MIVTTAGRTNVDMIELAKKVSTELGISYIHREKRAIKQMQTDIHEDVLVVGKNRIEIHPIHSDEPLFFHPNSSMFRIKRLMRGDYDPFIQVSGLQKGDTLLDCTLGLGSDSIVASYFVGETGRVTAIEGNKYLYYLLKIGLLSWDSGILPINIAMANIQVKHDNYINYLKHCPDNSYDVVYFDPMFEETIEESDGIRGLRKFAIKGKLSMEVINEAKRVARNRIVLKDHWKNNQFEKLGFTVFKRKTAKFHFGVIEL